MEASRCWECNAIIPSGIACEECKAKMDKWRVTVFNNGDVVIDPPRNIDKEYDDLMLRVTGNMLAADKVKIGQVICDTLNA